MYFTWFEFVKWIEKRRTESKPVKVTYRYISFLLATEKKRTMATFKTVWTLFALVSVFMQTTSVSAFANLPPKSISVGSTTSLNMFGKLGDAFKNDDSLGKAQNAGLKNGPRTNENVTFNGKQITNAVVGQKVSVVAAQARVKIAYNCQQGDCGTCMIKMNGRKVKAW